MIDWTLGLSKQDRRLLKMLPCLLELIISDKVAGLSYLIQLHQIPSMTVRPEEGHTDGALEHCLTAAAENICHLQAGVVWV